MVINNNGYYSFVIFIQILELQQMIIIFFFVRIVNTCKAILQSYIVRF